MEGTGQLPGLGGSLAVSLASLGIVCLLAYVSLRFLARRGFGRGAGASADPIRVLGRCPLEPRRSLYLVEVAGRRFLVGVGGGPMTALAELAPTDVIPPAVATGALGGPASPSAAGARFADVLARLLGRRSGSGS